MRVAASEAEYESFMIFNLEAIFTNSRIDRLTVPDGLYAYDLRDACDGEPNELRETVFVNHMGTVITKEPIIGAEFGMDVRFHNYNFIGDPITLEEFMETQNEEMTQSL